MLSGSIVAIVTPMFEADDSVDLERLRRLCEWHIEQETAGIVVMGTTGESGTVSDSDYEAVIGAVVEQVDGRLPVIAGAGAMATAKTIELTKKAAKLGADAALVVTPYYCKPTQKGLYQHFMAVADASPLPIILYNVPSRCGVDLANETIAKLAEHDHVVGLKEASGDVSRVKELKALCRTPIQLFSGDDATACDFLEQGGDGFISVTANVAPQLMSKMCHLALNGNLQQARLLDEKLAPLHKNLFLETSPIPVKWALHKMGMMEAGILLPLTPLEQQYHQAVLDALEAANVKIQ